ncbi:hypothetical protein DMP11_04940, partial [Parvibacter caecicola]
FGNIRRLYPGNCAVPILLVIGRRGATPIRLANNLPQPTLFPRVSETLETNLRDALSLSGEHLFKQ